MLHWQRLARSISTGVTPMMCQDVMKSAVKCVALTTTVEEAGALEREAAGLSTSVQRVAIMAA